MRQETGQTRLDPCFSLISLISSEEMVCKTGDSIHVSMLLLTYLQYRCCFSLISLILLSVASHLSRNPTPICTRAHRLDWIANKSLCFPESSHQSLHGILTPDPCTRSVHRSIIVLTGLPINLSVCPDPYTGPLHQIRTLDLSDTK